MNKLVLRDFIREYLLKQGFEQISPYYFKDDAPGILPTWTEVIVDCRYFLEERLQVFGQRGDETEFLFKGDVYTMTEFVTIMKCTKAIDYEKRL